MNWAEVKAINSTLGTSNFKALDKIFVETFYETKTMVPSDELYKDLGGKTFSAEDKTLEYVCPIKIKAKVGGRVTLRTVVWSQYLGQQVVRVIANDDTEIARTVFSGNDDSVSTLTFSFSRGDELSFVVSRNIWSNYEWKIKSLALYGTVIESMFEEV